MPAERDLIYLYDGSFNGFLSCVYESVYSRCVPIDIQPEDQAEPSLYAFYAVKTNLSRAERVASSFRPKIGVLAPDLVRDVFCSCLPQKEMALLRFLLAAYRRRGLIRQLGHPLVAPLLAAQKHLHGEVHQLLGFIRFADTQEALVARISPRNFVLPYLAPHFTSRFAAENFLIYDDVHHAALLWQNRNASIVQLDGLELPPLSDDERMFRALWRQFVSTVAIEARRNPRCQMTHMPKRYWAHMVEWQPVSECRPALPELPQGQSSR